MLRDIQPLAFELLHKESGDLCVVPYHTHSSSNFIHVSSSVFFLNGSHILSIPHKKTHTFDDDPHTKMVNCSNIAL